MALRCVTPLDQNWQFKQADKDDKSFLPVSQFPTMIHLDLMHHKIIEDPYIGKNELDVQWVGEKVWVYKTTFSSPNVTAGQKVVIAFDGLDTFATVELNGEKILETDNMFIPERVDVTRVLKEDGENEMVITFECAYLKGWERVEQHPDHKWGCWNGDISRLAVRKAQYHWVRKHNALPFLLSLHILIDTRDGIGVLHSSPAAHGDQSTSKSTILASPICIPISLLTTH